MLLAQAGERRASAAAIRVIRARRDTTVMLSVMFAVTMRSYDNARYHRHVEEQCYTECPAVKSYQCYSVVARAIGRGARQDEAMRHVAIHEYNRLGNAVKQQYVFINNVSFKYVIN